MAQKTNTPLYYEIPNAPEKYSDTNVAARMIDGLGFRYYWATDGLTEKDLAFKPSDDARTSMETIDHIDGLCRTIVNGVKGIPNTRNTNPKNLTFEEKRKRTLENIRQASDLLRSGSIKLQDANIIFQRGENTTTFPFWNMINGPIADAIYHTGQIVSFRRSSGNPVNPNISVLRGTVN